MQQYKPGDPIGGEYTVLEVFGGEKQSDSEKVSGTFLLCYRTVTEC